MGYRGNAERQQLGAPPDKARDLELARPSTPLGDVQS
jgi:hypothetical protein